MSDGGPVASSPLLVGLMEEDLEALFAFGEMRFY